MKTSFLLSSISRTGGHRVTVEMSNRLIESGHTVRLIVHNNNNGKKFLRSIKLFLSGKEFNHWGCYFKNKLQYFKEINDIDFDDHEIVIGVGSQSIEYLMKIRKNVIKVRFCHGFDITNMQLTGKVWAGSMCTIAVSRSLIPKLKEYGCQNIKAVIPNGIRKDQYYIEEFRRDGIGMIYSSHYSKAPENILAVYYKIKEKWPQLPLYIFGSYKRPGQIKSSDYWRFPSIAKSRELYNRAKVWLVLSRSEGFGLPLLEAMACGAACVSTNTLGAREIIRHNVNGYIVPIGDSNRVIQYIELLLNNENQRMKIVMEGMKTINYFTWERAVNDMEKFLKNILYECKLVSSIENK